MSDTFRRGVLAALALSSLVLSLLVFLESDSSALQTRARRTVVFEAADPPSAVRSLVDASQFTAYEQVGIEGRTSGNELVIKGQSFGPKKLVGGKFVVKKQRPKPIGESSAFPGFSIIPVKKKDGATQTPAVKLKAGEKAIFKKGDELFDTTEPKAKKLDVSVPAKAPVKFSFKVTDIKGDDEIPKVGKFTSSAVSFRGLSDKIEKNKKKNDTGRIRRQVEGQLTVGRTTKPAEFELFIDFRRGVPTRMTIGASSKKGDGTKIKRTRGRR